MEDPTDLASLAARVKIARTRRGWSKERAAREAGISSITWKRVEDGQPVQDAKLAAIGEALQLPIAGHVPNLLLMTAEEHAQLRNARNVTVHSHTGSGKTETAAEQLRLVAERNVVELQHEAELQAAAVAVEDPERAAQILVDVAWVVSELRTSVARTIGAMDAEAPDADVDEAEVEDAIARVHQHQRDTRPTRREQMQQMEDQAARDEDQV